MEYAKNKQFFNKCDDFRDDLFETVSRHCQEFVKYDPSKYSMGLWPAYFSNLKSLYENYSNYGFSRYFFANEIVNNWLNWVWNYTYSSTEGNSKVKSKEADKAYDELLKEMKVMYR